MMTKIKFCQKILKNQKEFFDSKKTINPKIRIESLKKLKKTIIKLSLNVGFIRFSC